MKKDTKKGMTRRNFTKAGAAASFAVLSSKGASAADSSEVLKVGLLGCGSRGTGALTQMLTGNENVKVIALADLFPDKIAGARARIEGNEAFAKKRDIKDDHCFTGLDAYKKILKTDIDILVEGTLPYSRPLHVEAAVNAGKHIFTEKPAASDPAGIHQFIRAAEKAKKKNLCIAAGTQRRHQKEYVETIKKIHDGAIGEIRALRAYWCGGLPFAKTRLPEWKTELEYCVRNWYAHCWVCGDNIVEQHVHNLDVCNWIMSGFGEDHPDWVFASGGRQCKTDNPVYGDLWDHFSCDFEYKNGVQMTSMCRHWNKLDGGVYEQATGTKGRSNCHDLGERGTNPYIQEHIDLVNAITGKTPYLNEGVQVAHSTMTAIMGRMSAYTGRKITWKDVMTGDLAEFKIVPEISWDGKYLGNPAPVPTVMG
jgi:myo-inositol 2-dehydrogenase / D-chiro-inositol 1-dehydrogenase